MPLFDSCCGPRLVAKGFGEMETVVIIKIKWRFSALCHDVTRLDLILPCAVHNSTTFEVPTTQGVIDLHRVWVEGSLILGHLVYKL